VRLQGTPGIKIVLTGRGVSFALQDGALRSFTQPRGTQETQVKQPEGSAKLDRKLHKGASIRKARGRRFLCLGSVAGTRSVLGDVERRGKDQPRLNRIARVGEQVDSWTLEPFGAKKFSSRARNPVHRRGRYKNSSKRAGIITFRPQETSTNNHQLLVK